MAIAPRLEVRQSQSLVMTPQLMQAIKLLQLSNLDLVAYVDAELERNPLLERADADDGPPAPGEGRENGEPPAGASADMDGGSADHGQTGADDYSTHEGSGDDRAGADSSAGGEAATPDAADWLDSQLAKEPEAISDRLDTDLDNVFPDDLPPPRSESSLAAEAWQGGGGAGGGEDYNLESFVAAEQTLAEHLSDQMTLAISDPVERLIAQNLIDNLDEAGYLRADLCEISEKLGAPAGTVETVLARLQTLEPTGVFARDLRECLALQLIERDRYDPAMRTLVENIELLARRDMAQLRALCGVDDEDLLDMIGEIRALDPRPGSAFGSTLVQPVVPDVSVRPAADGSWAIELNSENLPKVLVNRTYYASVTKNARGENDKAYLVDCLQTANWLVKSLDQRAKTILKVATEITRQQDAFLTYGVRHLRPLNLRTVADAIGMHESTVSRVTSNKYMATPRGIYEFKYFFTSAIASAEGGDAHSAEAVRHRIKQMIDEEKPSAILSDDTIVKMLKEAGIDIARRTVAKYREAMRIPSSVQRRREKRAIA